MPSQLFEAYIGWLNDQIEPDIQARRQTKYRLPSETEWEYAARAGTSAPTAYLWGDRFDDGEGVYVPRRSQGAPVAAETLQPNKFGVHGMLGLIWQYVADPWHDTYEGRPADEAVWISTNDKVGQVLRGGSWFNNAKNVRAGHRNGGGVKSDLVGFRLARNGLTP